MIYHFFSQGTGLNPLDHRTLWLYTAHRPIEMMSQHVEWIRASDWSINWPPFLLNLVHPLRTSSDLSLSWHTETKQRFKTVNGQPSVSVILLYNYLRCWEMFNCKYNWPDRYFIACMNFTYIMNLKKNYLTELKINITNIHKWTNIHNCSCLFFYCGS